MSERLPDGKGMWVRWPRPAPARVRALAAAGVEYLLVEVLRQHPEARRRRSEATLAPELLAACRAQDLRVIPWAFLDPRTPRWSDEAAATLIAAARDIGERWVVLDVEGSLWRHPGHAGPLRRLIDRLHAAGLLVAVTSYGAAWEMEGWAPCLSADAALWQLARIGPSAVATLRAVLARFSVVGVVAEPPVAAKERLSHHRLMGGLAEAMREAGTTGHLSTWVDDQYTRRMLAELATLEIPGRS